jgi:hypothetical protein
MGESLLPLCIICQREIELGDPVPWHGANAHPLCAEDIGNLSDTDYGEAVGRAVSAQHAPGTCGVADCVCHERLRE